MLFEGASKMYSKFKRSGVLTSAVDYFCLVCECRLHNEADASAHIDKPVHNKNLNLTEYFENQEDYVRKIKKWYFCELCNLLLATAKRVHLHVTEQKHIENRNDQILHRNGKFVIAFSKVQIPDKTWNGIIEDACVICNIEFENVNIHINESSHIIKLLQSRVDYDTGKNIYRKIDDSSVQCLTCNMIVVLASLDAHFHLPEHKKLYRVACAENVVEEKNMETDTIKNDNIENNQNREKAEEKCEVASATVDTNVSKKKDKNVDEKQPLKPVKATPISDIEICDGLNAKNYITKDEQGRPWCIVCNWVVEHNEVTAHMKDIHHKTMIRLHKKRLSKLNENADGTSQKNVEQERGILESIENFKNNGIKIQLEIQTVFCKKCLIALDFNKEFIENHIKEHAKYQKSELEEAKTKEDTREDVSSNATLTTKKKNKDKQSAHEAEEEIKNFVENNNMTYKPNNNHVYCKSCNVKVSPMLRNLKEHIMGSAHKSKVAKQNMTNMKNDSILKEDIIYTINEVNMVKVPMISFVTSIITIDTFKFKDILINMNICINIFSFVFIVNTGSMITCLVCKTIENIDQFREHMSLSKHEEFVNKSKVIELENEFIREVQPNSFHCGYCNIMYYAWCDVQNHLKTVGHRESRTGAQWRLEQYRPSIATKQFEQRGQFTVESLLAEANEDF